MESASDSSQLDMTVEEFLQSRCMALAGEINREGERLAEKLRNDFLDAKRELLKVHEDCLKDTAVYDSDGSQSMDVDDDDDQNKENESASGRGASTSSSRKAPRSTRKKKPMPSLHVLIEAGPHKNLTAVLKPRVGKSTASLVGRSTGKKFREKGLSLSKVG